MKKILLISCILVFTLALFTACQSKQESVPSETAEKITEAETEEEPSSVLGNFTATDLEGNEVTQDIFTDYDLTMINIWGTFCNPCLREMPDLGQLNQEYKDKKFQVIGIVVDVLNQDGTISDKMVSKANEIVEETGADYRHLLPSEDLIAAKISSVSAIPETVFVDKDGNMVGKPYLGAKDKEGWVAAIEEALKEVNK